MIYLSEFDIENKLEDYCQNPASSAITTDNKLDDNPQWDVQVIIPVYNVEKTIERCVDSILNQRCSYKIFITIINDGSTDRSYELLKKYEGLSSVEIINQSNKGLSGARNSGLKHIRARYVSFVDSDDFLPINTFQ